MVRSHAQDDANDLLTSCDEPYISVWFAMGAAITTKKVNMDRAILSELARKHWTEWLPKKVAELEAEGRLNEATQAAASAAQKEIAGLMTNHGFREHEAAEVGLQNHILLAPEPPPADDWQEQELAEMEREYQRRMADPD